MWSCLYAARPFLLGSLSGQVPDSHEKDGVSLHSAALYSTTITAIYLDRINDNVFPRPLHEAWSVDLPNDGLPGAVSSQKLH
jgi:hypothetical protein